MKTEISKALLVLATLSLFFFALSGCDGGDKKQIATATNLRQLSAALLKYHGDNKAWPEKLDDVKPLIGQEGPFGKIGGDKDYAALLSNPVTGANPGYEYVKPDKDAKAVIVLYQLRDGKRDTTLPVAYSDGSVHTITEK